jgi:hypothetical protein
MPTSDGSTKGIDRWNSINEFNAQTSSILGSTDKYTKTTLCWVGTSAKLLESSLSCTVREAHKRCRPTDDGIVLVSASFDPCSVLKQPESKQVNICYLNNNKNPTNEANAAAEDKQTVDGTHINVFLCLLPGEAARVAEHVNKRHGDHSVHVQNQVGLLGGGDFLHLEGVVQQGGGAEVFQHKFLDDLNSHVWVVDLHNLFLSDTKINQKAHCKLTDLTLWPMPMMS